MRLLDLLRKSTEQLEAAGIEDPLAEAELLVFYAANMERLDAYVNNPEVTGSAYAKARRYLKRRLKGEPVQYIVGHIEFFGLAITVGRGVLIPRPETEMLVEEAIKTADRWRKNWSLAARRSPLSVLDLCTGSGCIALALAKEFPDAEVIGTDLSQDALAFAEKNAKLNAIRNAQFLHGPLFDPVKGKRFDLIVANPPYIKRDEIALLQREIRDWEPFGALNGGEDGMDFYREILPAARTYLNPQGAIFLELGYDQADAVQAMAKAHCFRDVTVIKDYAGIKRILKGYLR